MSSGSGQSMMYDFVARRGTRGRSGATARGHLRHPVPPPALNAVAGPMPDPNTPTVPVPLAAAPSAPPSRSSSPSPPPSSSALVVRPRRRRLVRQRPRHPARTRPRRRRLRPPRRDRRRLQDRRCALQRQWQFGTYQMAALGGRARASDKRGAASRRRDGDRATPHLTSAVRDFDTRVWNGDDALTGLDANAPHADSRPRRLSRLHEHALSLYRDQPNAPLRRHPRPHHRAASRGGSRRVARTLIATYPTEVFPVDCAAVLSSIALHDRQTGGDHAALLRACSDAYRANYIEPSSRLLYQTVAVRDGRPQDRARA